LIKRPTVTAIQSDVGATRVLWHSEKLQACAQAPDLPMLQSVKQLGAPGGIRTRVTAVKGRMPGLG
jgi:hypothetical protein